MKTTFQKSVSFLDADNHRVKVDCEITNRNGYPEFTVSAQYLGSFGQCLDSIKPKTKAQKQLIKTWKKYHLQNIEGVQNFQKILQETLEQIQKETEPEEGLTLESTDEQVLKQMHEYGIDEAHLAACCAYVKSNEPATITLEDFAEAYYGEFDSDEEFTKNIAESCGGINATETWLYKHINWQDAADELLASDYYKQGNFYFYYL